MDEKYIALAVPFFFALIGVELWLRRRQAEPGYNFQDSITNLSCGIGQQVLGPFLKGAGLLGYVLLYNHARLFSVSSHSVWAWVALLFGVDLFYYVFHRASHRINVFWAAHVVHHQSEEYNLSVALRQSWIDTLMAPLFYLPLAVLGFSPLMFVGMSTINTLYQFWIHTRAVGTLGPLEWVLNTPSHHRVHHGVNPEYVDRNYAGIFIIWDRLFGTFQKEEQEPVYGTVKPLASFNPLWANLEYWVQMASMARQSRRFIDKLEVWFMPPEWRPVDLGGPVAVPEASRDAQRKYQLPVSRGLSAYVAVNFVMVTVATTVFLWIAASARMNVLALLGGLILATVIAWGGLFESKRWALPLELARLVGVVAGVAWLYRGTSALPVVVGATGAGVLALGLWVLALRPRPLRAGDAVGPVRTL